jgi:hypothetical protein
MADRTNRTAPDHVRSIYIYFGHAVQLAPDLKIFVHALVRFD